MYIFIYTSSIHNIWSDIQATLKTLNTLFFIVLKTNFVLLLYISHIFNIYIYINVFIIILWVQMTKNIFFKKRMRLMKVKWLLSLGQSEIAHDLPNLHIQNTCVKKINNMIMPVQISTIAHSFRDFKVLSFCSCVIHGDVAGWGAQIFRTGEPTA